MKKIIVTLTLAFGVCMFLSSCSGKMSGEQYVSEKLDIKIPKTESLEQSGEQSGFHGDGEYTVKMKFNAQEAQGLSNEIRNSERWKELPLETVLQQLMYSGTESNTYAYHFAEKAGIPEVEEGYYCFFDRNSVETDTNILFRSSFNFTFAVYDLKQGMLYYYELDT